MTAAASAPIVDQSTQLSLMGYSINYMTLTLYVCIILIVFMFWRIQKSEKLDFSDMLTKNGKSVSLTKILQLIGGITSTWIVIKLTISNTLTESIFGLYLAYVGAVEGYSKYLAARYNYTEYSVKEPRPEVNKGSTPEDTRPAASAKPDLTDLPEVR